MILDQVLRRKMQAISMDDTLQAAARKLRDLDRVVSPIVTSPDEQDLDVAVQILVSNESPPWLIHAPLEAHNRLAADAVLLQLSAEP
jgi:hypothetical protein